MQAICQRFSCEAVMLLVKNGADINCSIPIYGTPLMRACALGRRSIVFFLVKVGAKTDAKTEHASCLTVQLAHDHTSSFLFDWSMDHQQLVMSTDELHVADCGRRTVLGPFPGETFSGGGGGADDAGGSFFRMREKELAVKRVLSCWDSGLLL